jgi:alcohol dehydrogenase YqhD (iron-dependent ADH family)
LSLYLSLSFQKLHFPYESKLDHRKRIRRHHLEKARGHKGYVGDRAKAAIAKTEDFFHSMDIPTRLSDYTDQYEGTAEKVSETLRESG